MTHALRVLLSSLLLGCARTAPSEDDSAPSAALAKQAEELGASWLLSGTSDERFVRVGAQLRGFDLTMPEVGYRYGVLYWAGRDGNWELAKYQLGKIGTAVRSGLERRPEHATSAQMLDGILPRVKEAIVRQDVALFLERFGSLTAVCNACHQAERVPFVRVQPPTVRCSPASQVEEAR